METGSSLPWHETLRLATGENRLDASAVREYFRPLEEWLRNENLRTGEFIGWVYGKLFVSTIKLFSLSHRASTIPLACLCVQCSCDLILKSKQC